MPICPRCGGPVERLSEMPKSAGVTNTIGKSFLVEIAFLWLTFVVIGLGSWHWVAGAIAAVVGIGLIYYWRLTLTKYECKVCAVVWPFDEVHKDDRRHNV